MSFLKVKKGKNLSLEQVKEILTKKFPHEF
jgi:hypothetical protein